MNFGALKERAATLAMQAGWDGVNPAPDWPTLINAVLEEFSWEGEYVVTTDTVTLVAGTSIYALPLVTSAAAWKRVTDAVLNSASELIETDAQLLRRENPNWIVAAQGTPTRYFMPSPGNIQFYPTPSAVGTVTVRGFRSDGPLVLDTDTPACPSHFHEAIPLLAAWRFCKSFATGDDLARAVAYKSEGEKYEDELALYLSEQNAPAFQRRVRRAVPERRPLGWMTYLP